MGAQGNGEVARHADVTARGGRAGGGVIHGVHGSYLGGSALEAAKEDLVGEDAVLRQGRGRRGRQCGL